MHKAKLGPALYRADDAEYAAVVVDAGDPVVLVVFGRTGTLATVEGAGLVPDATLTTPTYTGGSMAAKAEPVPTPEPEPEPEKAEHHHRHRGK